ncbi:MAG: DUF1858 domain-containing protein [Candidatus Woesearchaeota archaeon]
MAEEKEQEKEQEKEKENGQGKEQGTGKSEGERKITKDMTIGAAIEQYPETAEVMFRHGLHCVGCHVAGYETIEEGASGHGIDAEKLVDDMNKALEKKDKGGKEE